MQAVCVKLDDRIIRSMDENIKEHNYSTRTDFIREAIRDKLAKLSKEDLLKEFLKFRGKSEKKTSHKDNRKTKEFMSKELLDDLEKRFRPPEV